MYLRVIMPWKLAILAWMMGVHMMALDHKEHKHKILHAVFQSRESFVIASANFKNLASFFKTKVSYFNPMLMLFSLLCTFHILIKT